jgi:hypothetical protein
MPDRACDGRLKGGSMGSEADDEARGWTEQIRSLGLRCKELFESRRWQELAEELGSIPIWAFTRPMAVAEARKWVAQRYSESKDFELQVNAVLEQETLENEVRVSWNCSVLFSGDSWEENEDCFDLHLGFHRKAESNIHGISIGLDYLGFTRPEPEQVPFPDDDEQAAGRLIIATGEATPPPGHVKAYLPVFLPEAAAQSLLKADQDPHPGQNRDQDRE